MPHDNDDDMYRSYLVYHLLLSIYASTDEAPHHASQIISASYFDFLILIADRIGLVCAGFYIKYALNEAIRTKQLRVSEWLLSILDSGKLRCECWLVVRQWASMTHEGHE